MISVSSVTKEEVLKKRVTTLKGLVKKVQSLEETKITDKSLSLMRRLYHNSSKISRDRREISLIKLIR